MLRDQPLKVAYILIESGRVQRGVKDICLNRSQIGEGLLEDVGGEFAVDYDEVGHAGCQLLQTIYGRTVETLEKRTPLR